MTARVPSLFVLLAFVVPLGCGPAVVQTPTNMRDVPRVHLAPPGLAFEVEMPAESNPSTDRQRIEGLDESAESTEWQVRTDDQSAFFSVTHVRYPAGLTSNAQVVTRILGFVPDHVAGMLNGRVTARSNVRASGGVRGVAFTVTAPDRSTITGRFLIRGDVGLLAFFAASPGTRWRDAGNRMLRSLRFL